MIEAVSTLETPVYFNMTTRRYIPEDSKLHTCRRDNLKSHVFRGVFEIKLSSLYDTSIMRSLRTNAPLHRTRSKSLVALTLLILVLLFVETSQQHDLPRYRKLDNSSILTGSDCYVLGRTIVTT
jgi:hypothetical protein